MSLISRLKNWATNEEVDAADLNAEFNNILNNFEASSVNDYSENVAEMREQTDPGESGTESLATSLAGELERIRFVLQEIKGAAATYWYESVGTDLTEVETALGSALGPNRISSALTISGEAQTNFLTPAGSGRTVTLEGSGTSFVYFIEGEQYTISTDVTATNLLLAPSSNNTATVNDGNASDGEETKRLGMYKSEISVDSMGAEITSLIGTTQSFALSTGAGTEYFTAFVESSTKLTKCRRGYFFDDNGSHVPAIVFADNDTVTLLRKTFIFAKTDGTLAVTYNDPIWSAVEPSSPAIGDYWFDLAADKWKIFNSVSYVDADAIYIGQCAQDDTNTVCARSEDIFRAYQELNTLRLERASDTVVRTVQRGQQINVNGQTFAFRDDTIEWDMTGDLETGVTEAANTLYFLYVTEDGAPKISDVPPLDLRGTRFGYYHPAKVWRCIGHIENDNSSNLDATTLVSFANTGNQSFWSNDNNPVGTLLSMPSETALAGYLVAEQAVLSRYEYAELFAYMGTNYGTDNAYDFTLPSSQGRFMRYHANGNAADPDRGSRTAATGGNSGDNVGSYQDDQFESHTHTGPENYVRNIGGAFAVGGGSGVSVTAAPSLNNTGGNETRPINFYAKLFIKVRNG